MERGHGSHFGRPGNRFSPALHRAGPTSHVVAVQGVTAYRQAFDRPKARLGEQESPWAGTRLFVAPNPRGLNAHATLDSLAADYRAVGAAAGIVA